VLAVKLLHWSDKIHNFHSKQYCERWHGGGLDVGGYLRKVLEGCKLNANFQSKCLNVERISGKYRTIKLVIEKATLLS
jgi:hypothetical protein